MPSRIPLRVLGILTNPVGTLREAQADDQGFIAAYIAVIVLVNTLLSYAAAGAGFMPAGWETAWPGIPMALLSLVLMPIAGIVFFLVLSLWIHLWVYVCGGRKGHARTFIATAYSSTPAMLFCWIPVIGQVFWLWSLILLALGIREYQEMSTERTILAVVIAILPFVAGMLNPGAWPFGHGLRIVNN